MTTEWYMGSIYFITNLLIYINKQLYVNPLHMIIVNLVKNMHYNLF